MNTWTAAIVEDSPHARAMLRHALERRCPDVHILHELETAEEAYHVLSLERPDIVFFDIELGAATAFDVLRRLHEEDKCDFDLIFVTANGTFEYARQAIAYSAMDFLLKPLEEDRLLEAVTRVQENSARQLRRQLELFLEHMIAPETTRMSFRTLKGGLEFVDLDDILYLEGDGQLSHVHLLDGRSFAVSNHLGHYVRLLQNHPERFFLISQSLLLNLRHLQHYNHGKQQVILQNRELLEASRRGGRAFRKMLRENSGSLAMPLTRKALAARVWEMLRGK